MSKQENAKERLSNNNNEAVQDQEVKSIETEQQKKTESKPKQKVRKRLDENMLVPIASGVNGGLTYISSRSGQVWKFQQYDDEDVMELRELRTMLSSARKFLQKGWIRILDPEVIEYLNLKRLQKEVVDPDDLDALLEMSPEGILNVIKESNANAKRLIYGFAKEKYINGELTNIHTIKAIEEGLGESLDPNI